jgi:CheY-like chemotaxis protein
MKTLLVVDDEATIAEMLQTVLEDEGYRVITAGNGHDALQRIAEQVPHLILSDVMMPVLDGRTLLAQLRANPSYQAIPFILMSAGGYQPDHDDGYQAFVAKPFDLEQLLLIIKQLLRNNDPA